MWTFIRIATRNILRNKSRTALTLAAIGLGVVMAILLGSIAQGFTNALSDDAILGKSGAVQVHRKGYFDVQDSSPLDFDMEQGGELERKIRSVAGVVDVAPRLVFQGLLNGAGATSMLIVNAVDPAHEYKVLPRSLQNIAGKAISEAVPAGAVIGLELADSLGFKEADAVDATGDSRVDPEPRVKPAASAVLSAARKSGQQNAMDLDIVGLSRSGDAFQNKRLGFVSLAYAQELLDLKGRVNEYLISVADREEVPRITADIARALGPEYEVQGWKEARPDVNDRIFVLRTILVFVCVVFLIIVVIGVINTMLMSVMERTREIGTMLAVGVKRRQITVLFLLEGLALAVLGGVGGALGGQAIVGGVAWRGGFLVIPPGASLALRIIPYAPLPFIGIALAATMLGSLFAAAYPAWRASRLRPVEALRAL